MTETIAAVDLTDRPRSALRRGTPATTGPAVAADDRSRRRLRWLWAAVGVVVTTAVVIGLWWAAVEITDADTIVAASPGDVGRELWENPRVYLEATLETMRTAGVGLLLGVTAGTLLATAKWWSTLLAGLVELPALFMRSVPIVAVIPVVSSVVGYGPRTTLLIAGMISFFPSFALIDSGMRNVPPGSDDLFRVIGARRPVRLWRLALPSALPLAATALRLSVTICILGGMASEYITGVGGLGGLYAASRVSYLHPARGWSVAVVTAVMSFVAFAIASVIERRAQQRFAAL